MNHDPRITKIRKDLHSILGDFEGSAGSILGDWKIYRSSMLPASPEPPLQLIRIHRRRPAPSRPADDKLADRFDYMLSVHAMLHSLDQLPSLNVPEELKSLILEEFADRCEDGFANRYERYSFRDSEGWNQLGSSQLQRVPLGLYAFNIAGIPRRNLRLCPARHRFELATFLAFQMRGFSPVFEVHLPRLQNRHISEDEVDASHRLLAQVAVMNPAVKGLYSSAWYIDPAVAAINPKLAFLREFFLANGGFVHRLGVTDSAVEDALRKSATRRKLYEEGRYQPTAWARYWPRLAMLKWAGFQ